MLVAVLLLMLAAETDARPNKTDTIRNDLFELDLQEGTVRVLIASERAPHRALYRPQYSGDDRRVVATSFGGSYEEARTVVVDRPSGSVADLTTGARAVWLPQPNRILVQRHQAPAAVARISPSGRPTLIRSGGHELIVVDEVHVAPILSFDGRWMTIELLMQAWA